MSFSAIWLVGSVVWAWGVYMAVTMRQRQQHRSLPPADNERRAELFAWNRGWPAAAVRTFRKRQP